MATTITLPTVGGSSDAWGPILNTAVTAVRDAADAAQSTATTASAAASAIDARTPKPQNKAGFYYGAGHVLPVTIALQANAGYFMPYYFDKRVTISGASLKIATAIAATLQRAGIYADDGAGKPTGDPLITLGTFDSSTTGIKTVSPTPVQLPSAGLYWVYCQNEGGLAPNVYSWNENLAPVPRVQDPQILSASWSRTSVDGSLPTSISPAGITSIGYRAPAITLLVSAVA